MVVGYYFDFLITLDTGGGFFALFNIYDSKICTGNVSLKDQNRVFIIEFFKDYKVKRHDIFERLAF